MEGTATLGNYPYCCVMHIAQLKAKPFQLCKQELPFKLKHVLKSVSVEIQ